MSERSRTALVFFGLGEQGVPRDAEDDAARQASRRETMDSKALRGEGARNVEVVTSSPMTSRIEDR
jgi:hypothetical protein